MIKPAGAGVKSRMDRVERGKWGIQPGGNHFASRGVRRDMDFERLRSMVAVPFASLFLILLLCTMAVRRPAAVGFRVPVVRIHHDPNQPYDCDGRPEFVRLTRDEKTWINATEIPRDRIASKIAEIMETRAERIVYVMVDSEFTYGEFAEFMGQIEGSIPDLHVVVISGEVRRRFEKSREEFSKTFDGRHFPSEDPLNVCDFVFSANGMNK
jgi:biopolymer transport protein ExbD